jgi:hypothetical protein
LAAASWALCLRFGTVLIFVVGVPLGPWFLLASGLLGAGVAAALYVWHKNHPVELADLHHPAPSKKNIPHDH